jgi:hypothetical protein
MNGLLHSGVITGAILGHNYIGLYGIGVSHGSQTNHAKQ